MNKKKKVIKAWMVVRVKTWLPDMFEDIRSTKSEATCVRYYRAGYEGKTLSAYKVIPVEITFPTPQKEPRET